MLWGEICERDAEMRDLDQMLKRREALQRNSLYPAEAQVNCPVPSCVGLGYLGSDTAMCFICEHQWVVDAGAPAGVEGELGTITTKQCPGCQSRIEKSGGCDHMTCRCGHEFWWTTLTPYRN